MKYQFFFGLDGEGLEATLDNFTGLSGGVISPWRVHSMGDTHDGFWVLFAASI
jgi:hypothetical protein